MVLELCNLDTNKVIYKINCDIKYNQDKITFEQEIRGLLVKEYYIQKNLSVSFFFLCYANCFYICWNYFVVFPGKYGKKVEIC